MEILRPMDFGFVMIFFYDINSFFVMNPIQIHHKIFGMGFGNTSSNGFWFCDDFFNDINSFFVMNPILIHHKMFGMSFGNTSSNGILVL